MKNCGKISTIRRKYNKSEAQRLRWTPELHRHFVQVVEELGGKYKATPKRILEMMCVSGLNISNVKSHLQTYRSTRHEYPSLNIVMPPEYYLHQQIIFDLNQGPHHHGISPLNSRSQHKRSIREEQVNEEDKQFDNSLFSTETSELIQIKENSNGYENQGTDESTSSRRTKKLQNFVGTNDDISTTLNENIENHKNLWPSINNETSSQYAAEAKYSKISTTLQSRLNLDLNM